MPTCVYQKSRHFDHRRNTELRNRSHTFSPLRTDLGGVNSRNRILRTRGHGQRNTSVPRPAPAMRFKYNKSGHLFRRDGWSGTNLYPLSSSGEFVAQRLRPRSHRNEFRKIPSRSSLFGPYECLHDALIVVVSRPGGGLLSINVP
jgi:hypothetical protein